jgi:hypothetical protein
VRRFAQLNASLLSPIVAFCAAWAFAALLTQYHLLNGQHGWSAVMIGVVVVVPLAFVAGGLIGEGLALSFTGIVAEAADPSPATRVFRRIMVVFVVVGFLELAHQFAKIGGVPLLSPQGNSLRFSQGGPTIVLTDLLTVAAIMCLVKPRELFARESRFELAVAAAALGGFALQAGRGSIVLPVIVATAGRWLYWGRPKASLLTGAGLIAFAAIVFGFYLRTRQNPYNPFEAELFGEILPDTPFYLQPLVPIYLAITTNFVALQGVVGLFPTAASFGAGSFDAIGLNTFIHSARNISDVSATVTPPWVTSTVAGPLWADGGFSILAPGVAITGLLSAGAFAMARRTRAFRWSLVAGYLLYLALFGLYTNLWTQQLDWLVIVPLLLIVGAIAEDSEAPPGLTGRVWARIKRVMTASSGTRVAEAPPERGTDEGRERRLGRGLVIAGLGTVAVLVVSGLVIQPLLPEPYPRLARERLPSSVASSTAILTNSSHPSDNEELRWVIPHRNSVDLHSYKPGKPFEEASPVVHVPLPGNPRRTSFAIESWYPWRAPALFSFRQFDKKLKVRVNPTWKTDGPAREFTAPLSAPPPGTARDLMISGWSGRRPDLFALTRGDRNSRPILQIMSAESGFRRQAYATRLPYRGLAPDEWSVAVTGITSIERKSKQRVVRGDRPDLVLVHHDPDKKRSDVEVLIGESGFVWNGFQRDLDTSGSVPPGTEFLIGSHQGATAIYEVRRDGGSGPLMQVFGLTTPPQFR